MPGVAEVLSSSLLCENQLPKLAERFVLDGPAAVTALCKRDQKFLRILDFIEPVRWSQKWSRTKVDQPDWIRNFSLFCYLQKRECLLTPVLETIIRTGRAQDFLPPAITLRHVTHLLAGPHGCGPEEVGEFFTRCFGPNWLSTCYEMGPVGALATNIRAIALNERHWLRPLFMNEALPARLLRGQNSLR